MRRESHVRFSEGLGVRFPGATQLDLRIVNGSHLFIHEELGIRQATDIVAEKLLGMKAHRTSSMSA
jgi:hypothetical protein